MAQHDYNIANASFPTVRTDINNVLSAINSSNSGSSRPSSAVAGTIWLDTSGAATAQLLKMYDGAADITLATVNFTANTVDFSDSASDLLTDTTPQLGGQLDVNGNAIGDGTLELLKFSETGSAVNEFTVANAASGSAPTLSATGDDTNIGINLTPKGSGVVTLAGQLNLGGVLNQTSGYASFSTAIISGEVKPNTNDGASLGSTSAEWSDLYLADGSQILFGNDQDVTLTHNADAGLTLNKTLTTAGANIPQQAITSSSNAVAWDASAKPNAYHATTENTTFSAPSNSVEGQFISVEIQYGGSHSIAWNTVFEFAASTAPTATSASGKTDILVFRYNGAVWQEVGRTLNLSAT